MNFQRKLLLRDRSMISSKEFNFVNNYYFLKRILPPWFLKLLIISIKLEIFITFPIINQLEQEIFISKVDEIFFFVQNIDTFGRRKMNFQEKFRIKSYYYVYNILVV